LIEADLVVLLTDQQGMFDADPRHNSDAKLISVAQANAKELDAVAGDGGSLGRGGMATKLRAARLAGRSGAATVIAAGREESVLARLSKGEQLGTLLLAQEEADDARKRWLAGHLQVKGSLVLDAGAVKVLQSSGSSLLAVGVSDVRGQFIRGELVSCVDAQDVEIARGLVNYSADEARKIQGKPSSEIAALLGYVDEPELIDRDNLVVL
jgi:glutamate 5-kinase